MSQTVLLLFLLVVGGGGGEWKGGQYLYTLSFQELGNSHDRILIIVCYCRHVSHCPSFSTYYVYSLVRASFVSMLKVFLSLRL